MAHPGGGGGGMGFPGGGRTGGGPSAKPSRGFSGAAGPGLGAGIGGVGFARPAMFKDGGMVHKTGIAKVHKGEYVIPKQHVDALRNYFSSKTGKRRK